MCMYLNGADDDAYMQKDPLFPYTKIACWHHGRPKDTPGSVIVRISYAPP